MLFWVTLVLFIIALGFAIVYYKQSYDIEFFSTVGSGVFGFFLIIEICIIAASHFGTQACVEKNKETFKAITYKIENGIYNDDFGLLTPEGMNEIQEWNEDVAYYQNIQNDFWLGIFVPDIYDQFEYIDYAQYKK